MRKKITCFTGMMLAVAVLFSATACSFRGEEITISRKLNQSEVFSIDGQSFRVSEMKLLLLNNMNLHGESYGIDLLNNENLKVQKKLEKYLKEYCLEEATRVYSMVALAKSSDIALTDEEQQTAQWAGEDCYQSLSDAEKESLELSQSEVEDLYTNYALAQKVYEMLVKDINLEVSDDEARVMQIRLIYNTDHSKIKKAKEQLDAQVEFSSVAANDNEAEDISLTLERGMLPEEVETVAFAMEDGDISDIIESEDGYYILCCDSKFDEALTEEHKADIAHERKESAFHDVYDPFVQTLNSKLNEEVWDAISIDELRDYETANFYEIYDKYFADEEFLVE